MNTKLKLSHDEINADGSTRVESLKIHANASEEDIETARLRAYDRNFRKAYQCGLSDRIAPLPPRLEEVEREHEEDARHRRIWSQYAGMPIHPRPQPCIAPRFLYEVLEDKANGTLLAELHRRSQLEKFNRINND